MQFRFFFFGFALCVLTGCAPRPSTAPAAAPAQALIDLQAAMAGSYDSHLQAEIKEDYYDVTLHMAPIWTDRYPGRYLYVEQALTESQDAPYRQRVYELSQRSGRRFVSKVYELPQPERFIGAHEDPEALADLTPAELIEREGCAVYLKLEKDGIYRGETKKDRCKSSLRGASYAKSRVNIAGDFVYSWDQGFAADGKQVWGATEGGYMFLRKEE